MEFEAKLIDKFLEVIFPLPDNFGVTSYDDIGEELDNEYEIRSALRKIDELADISYGMSKLVITSPHLHGVVIKIPFNGHYEYDCEYDEDEALIEEEYTWRPFCSASATDKSDYCLSEYEKYMKLKSYKLNCFVAKTYFYKVIDGVRIFLQEEIIPEEDDYSEHASSKESQNIAKEWRSEGKFWGIDSEWIANCIDEYGKEKVEQFLSYCNHTDYDILEDMHCGNYGYRENGTPCLLDFSNFNY